MADNYVLKNKGLNPLVNFNFLLRVELAYDLPCKSVKAFTRELEYEIIQEGGLNDYVHMRRKPISKPFTLEVERYAGTDYIDPLPLGADLMLPVFLFVSRYVDNFLGTTRTYVFTGCTVTKKVYGELQAEHSGLLTDIITIAYREMICIDTAFSDSVVGLAGPEDKKINRGEASARGVNADTTRLWAAWQAEIEGKNINPAVIDGTADLKQRMEEIQTAIAEIVKEYEEKLKAILKEREDKLKELQALDSEIEQLDDDIVELEEELEELEGQEETEEELDEEAEARKKAAEELLAKITAYEEQRAKILQEREEKVEEIRELREKELELVEENRKEMEIMLMLRKEKELEMKALMEEDEEKAKEYEEELAALAEERAAKEEELKKDREERAEADGAEADGAGADEEPDAEN